MTWNKHKQTWYGERKQSHLSLFLSSDSLLHVAAGELGSLLLHSQVQSGRQRPPSWLAEEAHPAGTGGEPVWASTGSSQYPQSTTSTSKAPYWTLV